MQLDEQDTHTQEGEGEVHTATEGSAKMFP